MRKLNHPSGTAVTRALWAQPVSDAIDWQHFAAADTAVLVALKADAKFVRITANSNTVVKFGLVGMAAVVNPALASTTITDGSGPMQLLAYEPALIVIPADATHMSIMAESISDACLEYFN